MSQPFRFKQFAVMQELSPMKVGTDGVLLGAWCTVAAASHALDVGCGTGLLALMLAQRNTAVAVTALEIHPGAVQEATQNAALSPFSRRIEVLSADARAYQSTQPFDLIVCNPPFFHSVNPGMEAGRSLARHGSSLPPEELLHLRRLLSPTGILAGIYPTAVFERFQDLALQSGLHLHRTCLVHPTPHKAAHRVLFEYSSEARSNEVLHSSLVIELGERHQYSEAYRALTKDFYLSF